MEKIEEYTTDQFIARDFLKELNSFVRINILGQKDNDKLFEKDGAIYKMEYPINTAYIEKSANKINEIYEKYLKNKSMNVYYAIIPDKNYYLEDDDHLKPNYMELKKIMNNNLQNLEYIDIWDCLKLEDYYKTDLHWRQEKLYKVVNRLEEKMKLQTTHANEYNIVDEGEFFGTYYGQLGKNVEPDKLYTLTNYEIEGCKTYNFENKETGKIYYYKQTADRYDIFLSGATPLISIENPNANSKKELLLFRDSFGSSIAPLLVKNYSKITLIDIRYISSKILTQYLEFENQDVLFLYSIPILNQNIFNIY